jgi:4-carboxymuconolactone decarboxylase
LFRNHKVLTSDLQAFKSQKANTGGAMYLPEIFKKFVEENKEIATAYKRVGELCAQAGEIEGKNQHLIQLGISIGIGSQGGVRSHARRALDAGATKEEVFQVVLLSMSIIGFPAMIAAYGWVLECMEAREQQGS